MNVLFFRITITKVLLPIFLQQRNAKKRVKRRRYVSSWWTTKNLKISFHDRKHFNESNVFLCLLLLFFHSKSNGIRRFQLSSSWSRKRFLWIDFQLYNNNLTKVNENCITTIVYVINNKKESFLQHCLLQWSSPPDLEYIQMYFVFCHKIQNSL